MEYNKAENERTENTVLCGASAYSRKYYFNEDFSLLPQQVRDELQIMCVMYTEEIGGVLTVEYDAHGRLQLRTESMEGDAFYDDIGGALRIKQLQDEKKELFEALELFYQVFAGEEA